MAGLTKTKSDGFRILIDGSIEATDGLSTVSSGALKSQHRKSIGFVIVDPR